jgi:predicted PurR-regulated permease PerM
MYTILCFYPILRGHFIGGTTMTDFEQKPVTSPVSKQRRSLYAWVIALVVLVLLVLGFFAFGGMNLINGAENTTDDVPTFEDGYTVDGQPIDPNAPVIRLDGVE